MIWQLHQLIGLTIAALFLCIFIAKQTDAFVGIAAFYSMFSAILLFSNPHDIWGELEGGIDGSSASTLVHLVLLAAIFSNLKEKLFTFLLRSILIITLADCVLVLWNGWGIFNASSADTAMIAMTFPLFFLREFKDWIGTFWKPSLLLPLVTIVFIRGSTACFILAFEAAAFLVLTRRRKYILISTPIIIGFDYWKRGIGFIRLGERATEWGRFLSWWWTNANIWVGTGSGSFEWLGPSIQGPERAEKGFYIMAHNDYVQVLFEQGIIGGALIGAVWIMTLWKLRARPIYFAAAIGGSVCMFTQYPLHFFLSQLTLGLLVFRARDKRESDPKTIISRFNILKKKRVRRIPEDPCWDGSLYERAR